MKKVAHPSHFIVSLFLLLVSYTGFSQTIKKGGFEKQNKSISGTFEIVERDGGTYIVLSDDFKTKSAPDLKLFLSKKQLATITGKNAPYGAVLISKLKSAKGGQSYKIPSNIVLKEYSSLLIHCEQYGILWGGSSL
ncbi:DM13 domain-containing protein [Flavobacteriaceae bacterium 3-367]|uniref:DM13 domain-containing protein n=1 Tax=Eudoraea algarum TaxID=3417568 RepID=UPI003279E97C